MQSNSEVKQQNGELPAKVPELVFKTFFGNVRAISASGNGEQREKTAQSE